MANKVLSIEIEPTITRVIEIEYKAKKPIVYNYFSFETPSDTVRQGAVKPNEAFVCAFKNETELRNIKTKRAIFSLTSPKVISREAVIPKVKKSMIQQMLDTSITEYFPVDPAQYHLVYELLEENKEKNELTLNLLAVPNELTAGYFEMAKALGVELLHVDFSGSGILKTYNYCKRVANIGEIIRKDGEGDVTGSDDTVHATAIFNIETYETAMIVASDKRVLLRRTLSIGVSDMFEPIYNSDEFNESNTPYTAYNVLCSKFLLRKSYDTQKESAFNDESPLRDQVTNASRSLILTINRAIEFFISRNPNTVIDNIVLSGGGTDIHGFRELAKNEIPYPIIDIDSMSSCITVMFQTTKASKSLTADDKVDEATPEYIKNAKKAAEEKLALFDVSRFVACFGAALDPLDLIPEAQRVGDTEALKKKQDAKIFFYEVVGAIALLIVSAMLFMICSLQKADALDAQNKVQKHIDELKAAGVEEVSLEYRNEKSYSEQLAEMYASSFTSNDQIVKFIELLEEKIPSGTLVTSLVANDQGITLNLEAPDKESVMKLIHDLRSFPMIDKVSSQSLTDNDSLSVKREAERIVSYAVTLTYKPVENESEAAQ